MARDWVWIDAETARAIHAEQIAEHGGPAGVRDAAGLDGTMARARNLAAYVRLGSSRTPPRWPPLMPGISPATDPSSTAQAHGGGGLRNLPDAERHRARCQRRGTGGGVPGARGGEDERGGVGGLV